MYFENVDRFSEWIAETIGSDIYDLDAILDDVVSQYETSGSEVYELRGYETQSGNPECYSFMVSYGYDDDGEVAEMTIIF